MPDSLKLDLRRLPLLDAVRGTCTMLVVLYHYKGPLFAHYSWPLLERFFNTFWTCLDCFFVLSGFLLGGILLDNKGAKNLVSTFYARRALRILPVYLLAVAYHHYHFPDDGLLKFFTFTQNVVWAEQQTWLHPEINVTWSLAVEEHFYLVLPVLIWLVPAARLPWVLLGLVATAPLVRIYSSLVAGNQLAASILMPCRMDGLFLGVLLAWLLRHDGFTRAVALNRRTVRASVLVLGALFAVYAMWADPFGVFVKTIGLSLNSLFYAVFLLWLLMDFGAARLAWPVRLLSYIGLGAFSIYLSHIAVISAVRAELGAGLLAAGVAAVLIGVLSFVSWHLVEKPCIQLGKRIRYARAVSVPTLGEVPARP